MADLAFNQLCQQMYATGNCTLLSPCASAMRLRAGCLPLNTYRPRMSWGPLYGGASQGRRQLCSMKTPIRREYITSKGSGFRSLCPPPLLTFQMPRVNAVTSSGPLFLFSGWSVCKEPICYNCYSGRALCWVPP